MNYYNKPQDKKYPRAKHEFYTTPPEATRALLSVEEFEGPIWEPACGLGHISDVLETAGHTVQSTDLILRGYGDQLNFLESREPL